MNMHKILQQNPEIWDLFTNREVYENPLRDKYDRFPYYLSKNRNIFEPIASQYLVKQGYFVKYPDKAPFAVCLTHDIDNVYQSFSTKGLKAIRMLKNRKFRESFESLKSMHSKKIPFCNFSKIMDIEEKYDAKSTFFFLAENPGERNYTYDIEEIEPEINNIIHRGWEVGLHGGHTTYLNYPEMKQKKERLEKITHIPVNGYRNHYLRFGIPDTWEFLSKAGFKYDATFGYADCTGFRNGMCHPFKPFNLNTNQEIDIWEIPLIVMDGTLNQTYMRLDEKGKWELVKMLINRVAACHGVFTLLWHNTYMDGKDLALYEKILRYCKEKNAWMTTGKAIAQTYEKQFS